MRSIHAVVGGTVQGVGFRYTTRRVARQLGLDGWVRNRADGTVELRAQGPEEAVAELTEFLEHGPRGAVVASVMVDDVAADPTLGPFELTF